MVEVVCEFDYEAEQSDELTIRVGDVIKNVVMAEGGWWEGELNGKKGMFPDNFVKVKKDQVDGAKKDEPKKRDVQASKRQSVRDLANKLKLPDGPAQMRKKDVKETKRKKAKVTFSYQPENDDEIALEVGDVVEIVKQEEEGWWEGVVNGKQGMFPSNFVELVEEGEGNESGEKSGDAAEQDNLIKGKKVQGIGLGNIFGGGPIKLRSTAGKKQGDLPVEPPKVEKREPEVPVQRRPKETKPIEKAVVRYSYIAENEDELDLSEGDTIIILEKELEDSGWWKGQLGDKIGVFPDNFVELIKEENPRKSTLQPKPKKPPPPAQVGKALPKVPDKAPVTTDNAQKHDNSKIDHKADDKPHPVVPFKKPMHPPPPLTKKPGKQVDIADEKPKSDTSFEVIEPTGDKLTHLTATRPRGPAKRPPSQPKSNNNSPIIQEEERNGDLKDSHWLKEEKHNVGHSHLPPSVPEKKEEPRIPEKIPERIPEKPAPMRPPDHSHAATQQLQSSIEDLRREFVELRANTVSKAAFNELKAENERLKQELENVKSTYSRRLKDIMNEVDDEKKIRLSTQVEMERIRKLVAESHV